MSEAEGAGTLQYKHATRMQGERGWTVKARGKSTKYLFVHKTSLHGNEVPHNSFPKQARPRRALTELRGVEGRGGPAVSRGRCEVHKPTGVWWERDGKSCNSSWAFRALGYTSASTMAGAGLSPCMWRVRPYTSTGGAGNTELLKHHHK